MKHDGGMMAAAEALPELTIDQAEHWIAAALAEAHALRQHDHQLFPSSPDPSAVRSARALHAAWARWADVAEALLERVRPLLSAARHVEGADELDHVIGRTRAMLQISPDDHLSALEEVRRGDVVSIEEVRRELRHRVQ